MSFKDAMDSIFNQGEMRNKINKLNNEMKTKKYHIIATVLKNILKQTVQTGLQDNKS
jgi:hypothetical protein